MSDQSRPPALLALQPAPAACCLLRAIAPHRNIGAFAESLNDNTAVFRRLQQAIDFSRPDGVRSIDPNSSIDFLKPTGTVRSTSRTQEAATVITTHDFYINRPAVYWP